MRKPRRDPRLERVSRVADGEDVEAVGVAAAAAASVRIDVGSLRRAMRPRYLKRKKEKAEYSVSPDTNFPVRRLGGFWVLEDGATQEKKVFF